MYKHKVESDALVCLSCSHRISPSSKTMIGTLRTRRRNRYGVHCCAITTALLLLFSITLLYSRLTSDKHTSSFHKDVFDDPFSVEDPLLQDSDPVLRTTSSDDRIDELDLVLDDDDSSNLSNEEELLRGLDSEGEDAELSRLLPSRYYFDHLSHVIRHAFDRRSIDDIDRWDDYGNPFQPAIPFDQDPSKVAIGSDDVPVDEEVRRKMVKVNGIEDVLLLKLGSRVSPLREGWGAWFDAKSDFLRKDKMFRSNLELLNPLNNLLLQDPDAVGATGLTRGDKIVQKGLLSQLKKSPSVGKKPLGFSALTSEENSVGYLGGGHTSSNHTALGRGVLILQEPKIDQQVKVKQSERRTLDGGASDDKQIKKSGAEYNALDKSGVKGVINKSLGNNIKDSKPSFVKMDKALTSGGGQRWGYFPGLPRYLSFSNFMDSFFRKAKCSTRVFMVWNSPSWMFTIRHQRALESLLYHHPDACVVIFSETVELDFLKDFVKDSFKVAVAMPNLEELLQDTPTSVFASVWHEWRRTRFYSIHYSELIRLAALYKYGGIYLDCDMIVLKPLSTFGNSVGMEELSPESPLNGAVMAFTKHSSFLMQCMSEFYSTYDDTLKRWNGAELLTRVAGNFSRNAIDANKQLELKLQPASVFFPISSYDIQRYLFSPQNDSEKIHQDALFTKIMNESYTFHFWNSLTSALVPESDSVVARILNRYCTRCSDLL